MSGTDNAMAYMAQIKRWRTFEAKLLDLLIRQSLFDTQIFPMRRNQRQQEQHHGIGLVNFPEPRSTLTGDAQAVVFRV